MSIFNKIYTKTAILADQESSLISPNLAYQFARLNIPGTDIERCQEVACKDSNCAYLFARDIPGADIEYCRKTCESDSFWLKEFDKMIVKKVLK